LGSLGCGCSEGSGECQLGGEQGRTGVESRSRRRPPPARKCPYRGESSLPRPPGIRAPSIVSAQGRSSSVGFRSHCGPPVRGESSFPRAFLAQMIVESLVVRR
jgi:hypothetical protein